MSLLQQKLLGKLAETQPRKPMAEIEKLAASIEKGGFYFIDGAGELRPQSVEAMRTLRQSFPGLVDGIARESAARRFPTNAAARTVAVLEGMGCDPMQVGTDGDDYGDFPSVDDIKRFGPGGSGPEAA